MKTVGIRDARIDVATGAPTHVVEEGPANVTWQVIPATNQSSTDSTTYQVTPPSYNVGLGRFLCQRITGSVTITGANLDNPAFVQYALRQWPLASCMTGAQVQLNNSTIANALSNQWMNAYARVANPYATQQTFQSGTAAAPDVLNQYADVAYTASSPFIAGADAAAGDANARPRTENITNITYSGSGANCTAVIEFSICEPITVGPFVTDTDGTSALFGLNQVNITISWANLWKLVSIAVLDPSVTISNVAVAFTSQNLLVNYVTPSEDSVVARPIKSFYNCPEIRLFPLSQSTSLAPGATANVSTQSITLPRCPRLAVVFATPPTSQILSTVQAATQVDAFLPITAASCSVYDKTNILGGATPEQLYEMSVAAGLNATQAQFLGRRVFAPRGSAAGAGVPVGVYCGAPLVLDFSTLSLPAGIAPGVDVQTQFQVNLSVLNNYFATATSAGQTLNGFQVNVLIITDGTLSTFSGASEWVLGGLTTKDVNDARGATGIQQIEVNRLRRTSTLSGGSFFDVIKKIGKIAASVATPILASTGPLGAIAAPVVGSLASKLLGSGAGGARMSAQAARRAYY